LVADICCVLESIRIANEQKLPYSIEYLFSKTTVYCVTNNNVLETILICGTVFWWFGLVLEEGE
jgi:hypothetical protein